MASWLRSSETNLIYRGSPLHKQDGNQLEWLYVSAMALIGQEVFEFKVDHFVQCSQKKWAYLA